MQLELGKSVTQVRLIFFLRQGRRRVNLEDALCLGPLVVVGETQGPLEMCLPLSELFSCAVLDGVGGRRAGEVASSLAALRFAANADPDIKGHDLLDGISADVMRMSLTNASYEGMCTTIAVLRWSAKGWLVSSAGDSSAYAVRDGHLVDRNTLDVDAHGLLLRCLGRDTANEPSTLLGWRPPTLLLATDGLRKATSNGDIRAALAEDGTPACHLWELTSQADDDVGVIVINSLEPKMPSDEVIDQVRRRHLLRRQRRRP